MLKNLLYILVTIGLIIYFIVGGKLFPQNFNEIICQRVRIEPSGDIRVTSVLGESNIRQQINKIDSLPINKSFKDFNAFRVEQGLQKNNALIDKSNIYYTQDGTLHVQINYRIPLFLLLTDKENYYVTNSGETIICNHYDKAVLPLPVVYGSVDKKMANGAILDIVKSVTQDSLWRALFTDFYIDSAKNLYLSGPLKNCPILFGKKREDFTTQLKNLRIFLEHVLPKFGWTSFSQISLVVPNQVIVTPTERLIQHLNPKEEASISSQ